MFEENATLKAERMAICRECPDFIKSIGQCSRCGCFMHVKTLLKNSECPLGKW